MPYCWMDNILYTNGLRCIYIKRTFDVMLCIAKGCPLSMKKSPEGLGSGRMIYGFEIWGIGWLFDDFLAVLDEDAVLWVCYALTKHIVDGSVDCFVGFHIGDGCWPFSEAHCCPCLLHAC